MSACEVLDCDSKNPEPEFLVVPRSLQMFVARFAMGFSRCKLETVTENLHNFRPLFLQATETAAEFRYRFRAACLASLCHLRRVGRDCL